MKYKEAFTGTIKKINKDFLQEDILLRVKDNNYVKLSYADELRLLSKYIKFYKIFRTRKLEELQNKYDSLIISTEPSETNELYVDRESLVPHETGKGVKKLIKRQREIEDSYKTKLYY